MAIGSINGYPVYMVTRQEMKSEPSDFLKAYDTWEEGTQKSQLSKEELNSLKEKYNSNNLSDEQSIQLFGDLVKAGVLTKSVARCIYVGLAPLDVSDYNGTTQGTLSKCNDYGSAPSYGTSTGGKGYSHFASALNELKQMTNVDPETSPYFEAYDGFLQIMEQLRRDTIIK